MPSHNWSDDWVHWGELYEAEYWEGWCAGISWVKSQSYWSSTKRPRGI